MGIILSSLRDFYFSLRALFVEIVESNNAFNEVLARINASPGLPVENPTKSFWMEDLLFPELCSMRSNILLKKVDIVIIGSGISGAAVARTILRESQDKSLKVVLLEARGICSGATGRNGGHVKIAPYEAFKTLKARFGAQRARAIVEFQARHLGVLLDLVEQEGLGGTELREVKTLDLYVEREAWEEAKRWVRELKEEVGDAEWAKEMWIYEGEDAREMFHASSHVLGAISYRAGALWPYRLVTSILSSLLKKYADSFSIETCTPARGISVGTDSDAPFVVHTLRGDIVARHVVHATNGHGATLIPGLRGKLFPVRGQMTAQRPGGYFPTSDGNVSWSVIHKKAGQLEYITQRPDVPYSIHGKGGEIMLGGALTQAGGRGLDEIGVASDADVNFNIGAYLGGLLPMLFGAENWGADPGHVGIKSMWTGIMGFTVDVMPFVGRLQSSITGREVPRRKSSKGLRKEYSVEPAEWIAAGYNGEGMVNAWLCGVAVGLMVLGKHAVDLTAEPGMPGGRVTDWLPAEYAISKERLDKASIYELASML